MVLVSRLLIMLTSHGYNECMDTLEMQNISAFVVVLGEKVTSIKLIAHVRCIIL